MPTRTTLPVHVTKSRNIARPIGVAASLLHTAAFLALVLYIYKSRDPQAPLLWGIFAVIDFPLSLLYLFAGLLKSHGVGSSEFVYLPYLIHGLLGAVWWYFFPKLLTPGRFGGVW